MKHGGATDGGVSENTREREEHWNSLPLCEFMVKGLKVCPARGRHRTRSEGVNSMTGLEERWEARFLRFLPSCNFWFLLFPSLCP